MSCNEFKDLQHSVWIFMCMTSPIFFSLVDERASRKIYVCVSVMEKSLKNLFLTIKVFLRTDLRVVVLALFGHRANDVYIRHQTN